MSTSYEITQSESKKWTADELLAGVAESPAKERMGFRYCVIADGATYRLNTKRALERELSCILSKAPKVFRNFDKGITIDFDV